MKGGIEDRSGQAGVAAGPGSESARAQRSLRSTDLIQTLRSFLQMGLAAPSGWRPARQTLLIEDTRGSCLRPPGGRGRGHRVTVQHVHEPSQKPACSWEPSSSWLGGGGCVVDAPPKPPKAGKLLQGPLCYDTNQTAENAPATKPVTWHRCVTPTSGPPGERKARDTAF